MSKITRCDRCLKTESRDPLPGGWVRLEWNRGTGGGEPIDLCPNCARHIRAELNEVPGEAMQDHG